MLLQLWRHMDGAMAAATMAFNVTRVDVGHTWDDVSWVTRFTTWGFFLSFSWRRRWLSRWWWFLGWFHWYTKTRLINWVEWETQAWLNILFCCLVWVEKSILESLKVRQIDWRWIIQQVASGSQVTSAPEAGKSSTACFHINSVTNIIIISVYSPHTQYTVYSVYLLVLITWWPNRKKLADEWISDFSSPRSQCRQQGVELSSGKTFVGQLVHDVVARPQLGTPW